MTRTSENIERARPGDSQEEEGPGAGASPEASAGAPRVLVVEMDHALLELLREWLAAIGCLVTVGDGTGRSGGERFDLVLVDVPFPRRGGTDLLRNLAAEHPNVPVLALSCTFFAGVAARGAVARSLGVAGVLPKPLNRASLIAAVQEQLHRVQ